LRSEFAGVWAPTSLSHGELSDSGGPGALERANDTKVLDVKVHSRKDSTAVMLAVALKALLMRQDDP